MSYVVTTKRCNCDPVDEDYPRADCPEPISRREVPTLDEARTCAEWAVMKTCPHDGLVPSSVMRGVEKMRHLPYTGGVVGPLPDGTVIEVAPQ